MVTMANAKQEFYEYLNTLFKNPETLAKVKETFDEVWDKIVMLPASKSGRYHHVSENYKPFGLINHMIRVVWMSRELVREECGYHLDEALLERVTIAALFHDLGKIEQSGSNHGVYGLKYLERFESKVKLLCKNHMHKWSPYHCSDVEERIVAYGDYIASRPEIEIRNVMTMQITE